MLSTPVQELQQFQSAGELTATTAPLSADFNKYASLLGHMSLSESERHELLTTLWSIMSTFVDLGFGVDSVQHSTSTPVKDSASSESHVLSEAFRHDRDGAAR